MVAKKTVLKKSGKTPSPGQKRVRFTLPAQRGKHIHVAGTFNAWNPTALPMKWSASASAYTASLILPAGRFEYKYVIDGYWCIDPYCPEWVVNEHGSLNSVLRVT